MMAHDVTETNEFAFNAYDELAVTSDAYITKHPMSSFNVDKTSGGINLKLGYVQMTAFDPTGQGRNDHFAVIGIYEGKAYL